MGAFWVAGPALAVEAAEALGGGEPQHAARAVQRPAALHGHQCIAQAYGGLSENQFHGVIAAVTMTVGNLAALGQDNIKRMLAYSAIAGLYVGLMPAISEAFNHGRRVLTATSLNVPA